MKWMNERELEYIFVSIFITQLQFSLVIDILHAIADVVRPKRKLKDYKM